MTVWAKTRQNSVNNQWEKIMGFFVTFNFFLSNMKNSLLVLDV